MTRRKMFQPELLDAGKVFHRDRVFTYRQHPTVAGFANFFRYKMLLENGGWWVDMDTVCVAPFDFARTYVLSSEGIGRDLHVNNGMLKTPAGSDLMRRSLGECEQMDTQRLEWGQSGPLLLGRLVREFALQHYGSARRVLPGALVRMAKTVGPGGGVGLSGSHSLDSPVERVVAAGREGQESDV